jgi:hypothetical protein
MMSSSGPGRYPISAPTTLRMATALLVAMPLLFVGCGGGSNPTATKSQPQVVVAAAVPSAAENEARCTLDVLDDAGGADVEGNISVESASLNTAGSFTPPGATAPMTDLPDFCRVQAVARPTSDSHINIEIWLPTANWGTKYLSVGEGGLHGQINYNGLASGVRRGYATASTDAGHQAADTWWMVDHPEKVIDAGYRGKHLQAVATKALIATFYGSAPVRSYHAGCSGGGRQGLMELQRYPDDYDGYVVGAPANNWTGQVSHWINMSQAVAKPGAFIPADKAAAVTEAALNQCDSLDGVTDGIITDPRKCNFNPDVMICTNESLTQPQVAALKEILGGPVNSAGQLLFPGYDPGTNVSSADEPVAAGASAILWTNFFGITTVGGMLYNRMDWDYKTYNLDVDAPRLEAEIGPILNANDPDLRVQKAKGIKVIQYHGWVDQALSARESINYYDRVVAAMGGLDKTKDFYRLFMAPGMAHCFGGPGPNYFGQAGGESVGPALPSSSADDDILKALDRWVEEGVAPDQIIATKFKDNVVGGPVEMRRPLCPHPQVQKYNGTGDPNVASSFSCAAP